MPPLEGILVVDLSQFLSGPCASLRLADLGARVIKVEKPVTGDLCRQLYVSNVRLDGESTVFHAINRNKESIVADLKTPEGLEQVKKLIRRADVVMHNFRPGVIERLGLGYESVRQLNPQVVYGQISGYGQEGPWRDQPGQDLLLQSLSGLTWLSGDAGQGPVPMGLAVADILCGMHLVQGILACLVRRSITGQGGLGGREHARIGAGFPVRSDYDLLPRRRPADPAHRVKQRSCLSWRAVWRLPNARWLPGIGDGTRPATWRALGL